MAEPAHDQKFDADDLDRLAAETGDARFGEARRLAEIEAGLVLGRLAAAEGK